MKERAKNYRYSQNFKDAVLKEVKGTELFIDEIDLNVVIPENKFSKAALRK